jgi:NADH-quinone oxidoreductase subunit C
VLEEAASVDMPTVYVDREHLLDVCQVLRDSSALEFAFLSDLTAADYLPREPRFEIVYHLASLGAAFSQSGQAPPARRFRLKVRIGAADPHLPTVSAIWPTAGWPEREVWDLFGIVFDGHKDLRRILMTDEWEGHPLRKDYPVQIRKETSGWSPLQMTPEEFAANIREARAQAGREPAGRPRE